MSTSPFQPEKNDLTPPPQLSLPPLAVESRSFIYHPSSSPEEAAPKRRAISPPQSSEQARVTTNSEVASAAQHSQANIDLGSSPSIVEDLTHDPDHAVGEAPASTPVSRPIPAPPALSAYTCPICYSAPTDATLTPCGHIMCGSCLFGAVRAARTRVINMGRAREADKAYCPVCRTLLAGWDGRGRGVIGLEVKTKAR